MKKTTIAATFLFLMFAARPTAATPPALLEIYAGTYLYHLDQPDAGFSDAGDDSSDDDGSDGGGDTYDDSGDYDDAGGYDEAGKAGGNYDSAMAAGRSAEKAGDAQLKAGDIDGALKSYDNAFDAYGRGISAAQNINKEYDAWNAQTRVMTKQAIIREQ